MQLFLLFINMESLYPKNRLFYLYIATVWLTLVKYLCIITKRNLVSWCVPFVFLVMHVDVDSKHSATSEPGKNMIGQGRGIIMEITVLDFYIIVKNCGSAKKFYRKENSKLADPSQRVTLPPGNNSCKKLPVQVTSLLAKWMLNQMTHIWDTRCMTVSNPS